MIKSDKEFRFAIIGTGPAGFYMAKNLIKHVDKCRVDLIDRNPHPFGLIRTGVAPDHQAMKRIENDFSTVLASDKCQFFGNVWVGNPTEGDHQLREGCKQVSIDELRDKYSAVILAYGATSDRDLGLEGEHTLQGILPSRRVVNWYNGSLDNDLQASEFDVRQMEQVAMIGNGNIACDMARMLLKNPKDFRDSDTPLHVLEALEASNVHTI